MKLILFWRGIEDEDIKDEHEEDDNGKHKKKERSAFIYLLIFFDLIAVLAQVSGSLLWCLLQYLQYPTQIIKSENQLLIISLPCLQYL